MDETRRTKLFHQWVWPLRADVLRVARMLSRDASEADDLAQETLIKAFHAIETFRESAGAGGGAKAWLMTILRNTRIDRLRAGARMQNQRSLDAAEMDIEDPRSGAGEEAMGEVTISEEIIQQFSDAQIIRALQELPEEIRWTMLLVEVQGMSHEEAAGVMGVPAGTVKSRAFRGRGMLKVALAGRGGEMQNDD